MGIHIGSIIKSYIKDSGLKVKYVADFVNISESNLYDIYRRESIDVVKMIKFSQLFNKNLFLFYLNEEPIKSMFDEQVSQLHNRVLKLEDELRSKEEKIADLNQIIDAQNKVIALQEKKRASGSGKK
ncbi:hypothetical protein [Parapedobacter koreensis]|uniref:Uncharacterized protein n=1 Tax=Parapedobacter koreensis TaxID=332977 RepID=A0A1H7P5S2_9SPHI|nr:hypothetical protein [Parapedobacter koreensis]SEL30949.1 hypothetical protein SAMN05421740_104219 [Parapedobacter koreensis]